MAALNKNKFVRRIMRMQQKGVGIGLQQHLAFIKVTLENSRIYVKRPPDPHFAVRPEAGGPHAVPSSTLGSPSDKANAQSSA